MALSHELISQFAKLVNKSNKTSAETTVYGEIVTDGNGNKYVKLDGSDQLTAIADENRPTIDSTTANVNVGDRVSVLIKDHTATITGNVSSPAARNEDVENLEKEIKQFDIVIAEQIQANEAYFKKLLADEVTAGKLTVAEATVVSLIATEAEVEDLIAEKITVTDLIATKLNVDVAEALFASIENLEATNAVINNLVAEYGTFYELATQKFAANEAAINDLKTNKLDAESAKLTYANIDFSNIKMAAVEELFAKSGIIKDLVVGDTSITGELVGVTLKGDLIEAGTLKADKLVVKGSDGIFYKLNVEAGGISAEEAPTDGLHGSVIVAKSITAEKVDVKDLVAFGATIGGFKINSDSIHSQAKTSATSTVRGFYVDDTQFAVGDSSNFLRYYKDSSGKYKLEISADSISIGSSSKSVESIIDDAQTAIDAVKDLEERADSGEFAGEDATVLRIDSSRGTVFKNNAVSTVLSAVVYKGSKRITDITTLREEYGAGAYLEWLWQKMGESSFGTILSTDSRIGQDGFTFTLSPADVDTKVVFMCQLVTE